MKSLKKQAVFPVLMLLVVTALALIGSSFAWFSIATTASVDTFQSTATTTGSGIKISTDGITFGTTSISISNCTSKNLTDGMIPVSTAATSYTGGILAFYKATIIGSDPNGILIEASAATALTVGTSGVISDTTDSQEPGYIAFDIYFQLDGKNESTSESAKLYLNTGSTVVATNADGGDIAKAIRVAFIDMGSTTDLGTDSAELIGLSTAESCLIWQPGEGADYYGLIAEADSEYAYQERAGFADPVTSYDDDDLIVTNDETTGGREILTLGEGYNKVRVYVWLEGNDPDCSNSVSSKEVNVTLNFFVGATA